MVPPFERSMVSSFDGTPLAVQTLGPADAPVVLLANGAGTTADDFAFVLERFGSGLRFVSWDYRGLHGSARPLGGYAALTVRDHARDAVAVLDALGVREFHGFGWSMGVQVLLETQRDPGVRARTLSLVLQNGMADRTPVNVRGALRRATNPVLAFVQRFDGLAERVVARIVDWDGVVSFAVRVGALHHGVDKERFLTMVRRYKELDLHLFLQIVRSLADHDATDVLSLIRCPTLVLQASEDRLSPLSEGQRLAQGIPGAQLEVLAGGSHHVTFEMPALINDRLASFWRAHAALPAAEAA